MNNRRNQKLTNTDRAIMRTVLAFEFDEYEAMLMMGVPFADVLARRMADDARDRVVAADPESGVFATITSVDELPDAAEGGGRR